MAREISEEFLPAERLRLRLVLLMVLVCKLVMLGSVLGLLFAPAFPELATLSQWYFVAAAVIPMALLVGSVRLYSSIWFKAAEAAVKRRKTGVNGSEE